jgi:hypothetical protein
MMNNYKVWIGTPARNRSILVTATDPDRAVEIAVAALIERGESEPWLRKYAANRHPKIGTCRVEKQP